MDAKEQFEKWFLKNRCKVYLENNMRIEPYNRLELQETFTAGYHARDKELQNEDKDIGTAGYMLAKAENKKEIEKLKELLKKAKDYLCISCCDIESGDNCSICPVTQISVEINEELNNDK